MVEQVLTSLNKVERLQKQLAPEERIEISEISLQVTLALFLQLK
jgi:hypothetical protein